MAKDKKKKDQATKRKFALECSDITAGLFIFLILTMFTIVTFYILLQQIFESTVPAFFWASFTMQVFTPIAVGAFAAVVYLLFFDMLGVRIPDATSWFKGTMAMSTTVTFFAVFTWALSAWLNLLTKRTTMPVYMFATSLILTGVFLLYRCYTNPKDFDLVLTDEDPPPKSKKEQKPPHVRKKRRVKRDRVSPQASSSSDDRTSGGKSSRGKSNREKSSEDNQV